MHTFRADLGAANDNGQWRKLRYVIIALVALSLLLGIAFYEVRSYLFHEIPSLPEKDSMWEMNLKPNMSILDMNGDVIGHRGPYIGRPLRLSELPPHLPSAFLAIEDERFYQHSGIDRKAILRALLENTRAGETRQGASTLTQQLIKNMLLTPEQNYRRKFQEMWLAYEMERVLTKPEILELYLNRIDLGNRSFGVEAASQRYFGKSARDVSLSEAALLAALPKAPSRLDPTRNFEGAWARAKLVLQRMYSNNLITSTQMSEAENTPPTIIAQSLFEIDADDIGHFFDMVSERAQELVTHDQRDLIVYTTLDPALHMEAIKSLNSVLDANGTSRRVSEGSMVVLDNSSGAIRALVGGRDYSQSKFNRAVQAKRQPGSSFKAFVYAAAMERGFSPGTVRIDQPTTIGDWSPSNYTERYRGPMTIRQAFMLSINTIAAQVGAEIGPGQVAEIAKRFGILTPLRPDYSIALGASEVTLMEMTGAFSVFPNEGIRQRPYFIQSISNTSGDVLFTYKAAEPERVYSQNYSRRMVDMLSNVISRGTGYGARLGDREVGGKTGTSQDFRDAWFIGFSHHFTAGVWMGNDDNSPMREVTGGLLPVDVWKNFMLKAHRGFRKRPLSEPAPAAKDEETRALQAFYTDLVSALTTERNLASGIAGIELSDDPRGGSSSAGTSGIQ